MWMKIFHRVDMREKNFCSAHDGIASFTAFFWCSANPPIRIGISFATETSHRLLTRAWSVCDLQIENQKRDDWLWLYLVTVQSHCVSFVNQFDDTSACYEVGCRDCSEKKSRQQHLKWPKVNSSCSWISWNYQNKARSICASLSISSRLRPALPSLSCFSSSE